jgi:uncharacterized protein YggE
MMRAILAVACSLMLSGLAQASITVTGTGKVKYVPDLAYLSLGASAEAKTASEAWKKNAEVVQKIFATLKSLGIDEKDIQTKGLSLEPKYFYPKEQPPQLVGYVATYDMQVTVRKIKEVGKVLDGAADSGANRRVGIQFASSDVEKLLDQARLAAVTEARKKADLYARGAGVGLGLVRNIVEGSHTPWQRYELAIPAKSRMADTPLPIAAGEQELSISVTLTYDLVHTSSTRS